MALADAATIAANAMNVFGLSGKDSKEAVDALAGAANASSADVSDLAMGLAQGGLAAKNAGFSIQDTTAILAAFADKGLKGSDAGTSLKSMLLRLVPASKPAAEAMADLGLKFTDANGEFLSASAIFEELRNKTKDLSAEQRTTALTTIFGTDAIRAATIAAELGADGFGDYFLAVDKTGTTAKVAEGKMKGLPGAIEKFKGSVETMLLSVGNALAPAIMLAGKVLGGLADAFSSMPGPVQTALVAFAALAAALGPVLFVIGSLMSAVAPGGVLAVGFAALTGPVGIAIAALVGLGLALTALWNNSETFRNMVITAFEAVKVAFAAIAEVAGKMFAQVGEKLAELKTWWDGIWPQFSEAVGHVWNVISTIIQTGIDFVMGIWNLWGDDLLTVLKGVWTAIWGVIEGTITVIQGIIQTVLAVINGDWGKAWEGIKKILEGVWIAMKGLIEGALGVIKGIIGGAWDVVQGIFSGAWNAIKNVVMAGVNAVIDYVKGTPDRIRGVLGGMGDLLTGIGRSIMDGLLRGIREAWERVAGYLSGLATKIKNLKGPIEKDRKMLIPEGQAIMDSLLKGFSSRQGALAQTLGAISKQIQTGVGLGDLNVSGTLAGGRVAALTPTSQMTAPVYEVSVNLPDRSMKLSLDSADPMSLKRFIEQLANLLAERELSFA